MSDLVVRQDPAPNPAPAPPPNRLLDPDAFDRAEALREVAEEEARARGEPAPPATSQPKPTPTPTQAAPGKPPRQISVPKARLDQALAQLADLKERNAYLQGLATRQSAPAAPGPAAPQEQTIEQQLQAQAAIILDAGKKFDDGEISMVEFKRIEFAAEDVIQNLRSRHLLQHIETHRLGQAPGQVGLADAAVLDHHVEQMAQEHPWSAVLHDQELSLLAGIARAEQAQLGHPIGTGPAETLRLRQAIAELSDTYGPRWYPSGHPSLGAQPSTPQPAPVPAPQARGSNGAGQRAIDVASRQPPTTSGAGYGDVGTDQLTETRIEQMTEDEILALPAATRRRLMMASS